MSRLWESCRRNLSSYTVLLCTEQYFLVWRTSASVKCCDLSRFQNMTFFRFSAVRIIIGFFSFTLPMSLQLYCVILNTSSVTLF